jgi:8-oxo-dGTP pyrophosphatase MutT (NUDIX family)
MDILKEIEQYKAYNLQEEKDKEIFIKFINTFDNYLNRENEYGHICSSAFVLNKERTKIVMIYHNIYKSWGWMGGHADGEKDLLKVAIQEAKEESGLENINIVSKEILTLDTISVIGHYKRGKYIPAHIHYTVAYLLEADENEKIRIKEDENSDIKWVPIDKVVELSVEPDLQYAYDKAISKMRELKYI